MSRIGRQTITIPEKVTVAVTDSTVKVNGPKDELLLTLPSRITVEVADGIVTVKRLGEDKVTRSQHGAIRAHLNNMITGVITPWKKSLEIRGTGYKASVSADNLTIVAGFIHPVIVQVPAGITVQVAEDTKITIFGADKTKVGQLASNIRKIKPPEPYKGKGIRYTTEVIKLKAGKTAKA